MSVYSPKTCIFAKSNKRVMTLIDFIKEYPDEVSCKVKFKQYREHIGVVCPKCGTCYTSYVRRWLNMMVNIYWQVE